MSILKQPSIMPKILFIDIETSPNIAYVWGKYEQNTLGDYLQERMIISVAWKWLGKSKVESMCIPDFYGYKKSPTKNKKLIEKLHSLFCAADIIVAQNGDNFDTKMANTEFIQYGLTPPPPYKTVDTLKIARSKFRFNSNKLDDLGNRLGLGRKIHTGGFNLWVDCLRGKKEAWDKMVKYNCLTPNHKVLTVDLKWKEIGDLSIGEKILGFDENLKDSKGNGRRLRKSTVVSNRRVIEDVYEVFLSNGDTVKCTKDHKWLCSPYSSMGVKSNPHGNFGGSTWKTTEQLMVNGKYLNGKNTTGKGKGSSIVFKYFNVEKEINSKDAGWLAGMFDGEGCLTNRKKSLECEIGGFSVSICQKVGNELERIGKVLDAHGVKYSINIHKKGYHALKSEGKIKSSKPIGYITINGKFPKKLEFLQKFRPERLINNINFDNLPRLEGRNIRVAVEGIKYIGKKEVVILETDTKTYIADGYAMHNCQDVTLLEKIYLKFRPWTSNHPNLNIFDGMQGCPVCKSTRLTKQGYRMTGLGRRKQYQCQDCGKWCSGQLEKAGLEFR